MNLTFKEYQEKALSTAIYPRQFVGLSGTEIKTETPSCIYPVFGLCGEIGEVVQELQRRDIDRDSLNKELGDVLWYLSAICSDLNFSLEDLSAHNTFVNLQHNSVYLGYLTHSEIISRLCMVSGVICESIKKSIRDNNGIVSVERLENTKEQLSNILYLVCHICKLHNLQLESVADANLLKLAMRKTNGTLTGSGSDR